MKQFVLFLLFGVSLDVVSQEVVLMNGDLIFQEACSDGQVNPIKEVTSSIDQYKFTHVGMVYVDVENTMIYVLEATIPRVVLTPLDEYLYPMGKSCHPISVVGRLKDPYQSVIPEALSEGMKLLGKEYDYGYVLNNDMYYCSELIYDILKRANGGEDVFPLNVMTFKSAETDQFTDGWIQYFEKQNIPIPEGEMGINPGAMSVSDVIDILFRVE